MLNVLYRVSYSVSARIKSARNVNCFMCHVVWQLEMASSSCEANQPTTPTSIDRPRRTTRRIVEPKTRRAVTAPKIAQKKNTSKKHAVKTKQDSKQADQLAVTEASSSTEPAAKRRKTKLNKKERDDLLSLLDSVDESMLRKEVCMKLNKQFIPEYLKEISNALCANEQPLAEIIATHRHYFSSLYEKCQKGPEPFLNFQLKSHEHCSAFILSSKYSLCDINLEESSCHELSETRLTWLKFCEDGGIPVPETNPIMITVSSAIYHFLLDFITNSQNSTTTDNCEEDGDDVFYRFGGSAISDMLHLRYKHIRTCKDEQRDLVSQEISIIQAMNLKDKTVIPDYLKYRDRGYMYFPDPAFLPFLRDIDASLKDVVSIDGFQQEGDNLVKVRVFSVYVILNYCSPTGCTREDTT